VGRSKSVSLCGLRASKDAGISSAKTGENPVHRKSKVSAVQFVCGGSVGPKARLSSVVDGCQVYIPEPGIKVKLAGTLFQEVPRLLDFRADPFGERRSTLRRGREKPTRYDMFDRTANRHR
jgi:hypothetical protein